MHARRLLLVSLVGSLLWWGPAPPAGAATTSRVAGDDRYATAAAVSRGAFPAGVPVAYVATGRDFADALAAGPAAARRGGPVLLVDGGRVPQDTATELDRLEPAEIVIVGGEGAVPASVADAMRTHTTGPVRRLAGTNRYGTAAAISADAFPSAGTAFVANGFSFADALAGVPAADRSDAPILPVDAGSVPRATDAELRRLGVRRIVVLGGTRSVGDAVVAALRGIAGDVVRWAGADRAATSAALSAQTFQPGIPVAYVASGASFADALAGGPAAAHQGGPILLARANCMPPEVRAELFRLAPERIVLLGGTVALGTGVERNTLCPGPASVLRTPTVDRAGAPVFDDAAPDPDLVRFGSTWFTYTTGTTWGNRIGVLTSSAPNAGWRTWTGRQFGSTALPTIPDWQVPDTQWAPGVYEWRGRFVMFYAARVRSHGRWCISVATASRPQGPFTDSSGGPTVCQVELGGSIDPQPFVDADGNPWLHWKNNDGSSPAVSRVWAIPLGADGTSPVGPATEVMAKNTQRYPWQLTLDNPQMVIHDGVHYLFFTGGNWEDDSYAFAYAVCQGAQGPCTSAQDPLLTSYGSAAGPGGGTVEQAADGSWWASYHAWDPSCTNDSCGGKRRLFVAPLRFG